MICLELSLPVQVVPIKWTSFRWYRDACNYLKIYKENFDVSSEVPSSGVTSQSLAYLANSLTNLFSGAPQIFVLIVLTVKHTCIWHGWIWHPMRPHWHIFVISFKSGTMRMSFDNFKNLFDKTWTIQSDGNLACATILLRCKNEGNDDGWTKRAVTSCISSWWSYYQVHV
jgi:hypothetical protein